MNKGGISAIVATVLLILLVLISISILAFFVFPYADSLYGQEDCLEFLNEINFDKESDYNCWFSENVARTGFSIKITNEEIRGFKVDLVGPSSSQIVEVSEGVSSNFLRMLNSDFGEPLEINNQGGVRTYVANGAYGRIDIYPILSNGKLCGEAMKSLEPNACLDPSVRGVLTDDNSEVICGDAIIGEGEVCDRDNLNEKSCIDFGLNSGVLACSDNCLSFDTSGCVSDAPTCTITSANWSTTSAIEGQEVYLIVQAENCEGQVMSFEIFEDDGPLNGDDPVNLNPNDAQFNNVNGEFRTSWIAEWQCDGEVFGVCTWGNPEYYFIGTLLSDSSTYTSSNQLEVTQLSPECGNGIVQGDEECDDGNTNNNDACTNLCQFNVCGDGFIHNNVEICDGNSIGCTTNDGYSGTQTCNAQCDGFNMCESSQYCGDGVINGNEQCDGLITCTEGGYNSGTALCVSCIRDYSGCSYVGNPGGGDKDPEPSDLQ